MLLLAEDDQKIADLILNLLRKDGYEVDHAFNGEEALMYVSMNSYEMIILDWMMPVLDGIKTCKILRDRGYDGGILMLTAKDLLDDKIIGLEAGADDYLVKPFEYRELLARLKALGRRSKKTIVQDIFELGDFKIDRAIQTAYYKNEALKLSRNPIIIWMLLFDYLEKK
jgi:DNA-binding response OmpR family regulator